MTRRTLIAAGLALSLLALPTAGYPTNPPPSPPGVPTLVQHMGMANSDPASFLFSTLHVYLPNNSLPNNALIVGVQADSTVSSISVTDNLGQTYALGPNLANGSNHFIGTAYKLGSAAGVNHLTITLNVAATEVAADVSEFSGVATSGTIVSAASTSVVAPTVATGSLTPAAANNLIYHYGIDETSTHPANIASVSPGSGFALARASRTGGAVVQYALAAGGAVTPTFTVNGNSDRWNSVAFSLPNAVAGTPPGTGIRVRSVFWESMTTFDARTSIGVQIPSGGNLMAVLSLIGDVNDVSRITGVTDSKGNTWTNPGDGPHTPLAGRAQILYAANATTANDLTATITMSAIQNNGATFVIYDIVGASTSPFDKVVNAPLQIQTGPGNLTTTTITPSVANGLLLCVTGINSHSLSNLVGAGFLTDNPWYPAEDGANNNMAEDNGWGHFYNPDIAPRTFTWAVLNNPNGVQDWVSMAIAFIGGGPPGTTPSAPTGVRILP